MIVQINSTAIDDYFSYLADVAHHDASQMDSYYKAAKQWFEIHFPEALPEQYQKFCTQAADKLGI